MSFVKLGDQWINLAAIAYAMEGLDELTGEPGLFVYFLAPPRDEAPRSSLLEWFIGGERAAALAGALDLAAGLKTTP